MTHKEFVERYQIKNYVIDNGKLIKIKKPSRFILDG